MQLYELRTALEVEAARLALERHGGRLPASTTRWRARARVRARHAGATINDAHAELHGAIVAAAAQPADRGRARARSTASCKLFMNQLEPLWSRERMAADHVALVRGLERDGPAALRGHLGESAAALVAAERDSGRPGRVGGPAAR